MARQLAKREAAKASPTSAVLTLPVVPHVGETDTDTLTEIPGSPAETAEEKKEEGEEPEDEYGYNWSEFSLSGFYYVFCSRVFNFAVKYHKVVNV